MGKFGLVFLTAFSMFISTAAFSGQKAGDSEPCIEQNTRKAKPQSSGGGGKPGDGGGGAPMSSDTEAGQGGGKAPASPREE